MVPGTNIRKHPRSDVKFMADIRSSGGLKINARIVDLSRAGFSMECLAFIPKDRPIYLSIPGFMHLEGRVVWRSEWQYGCEFVSPLHVAIFDHIVKEYPAFIERS